MLQTFLANQAVQNTVNRLPSQPEANPKQSGATTSSNAVTTRSGKITREKNPAQPIYVAPPRRTETAANLIPKQVTKQKEIEKIPEVEEELERVEEGPPIKLPFPSRMEKPKEDKQFAKFLEAMKDVQITIPILDVVMHVPLYAKFFKELITKKRSLDTTEVITLTKDCSAVIQNQLPLKLDDPGSFCVPCVIGNKKFNALCDLGSSVSVIHSSVCVTMKWGSPEKTNMTL
jgi:thioester reductase-like protein